MYNKVLGITDEDVFVERDFSVLNEWHEKLQVAVSRQLVEYDVKNAAELPDLARKRVGYWLSFMKLIRKHTSHLRKEQFMERGCVSEKELRFQRSLKYTFYSVCKSELPENVFEHLITLAKEKLDMMNGNNAISA